MKFKESESSSLSDILNEILQNSPLPYTAAATKITSPLPTKLLQKEKRKINQLNHRIYKRKPTCCRLDITHLRHELDTLDISTNIYIHTTLHTDPINNKPFHPTI